MASVCVSEPATPKCAIVGLGVTRDGTEGAPVGLLGALGFSEQRPRWGLKRSWCLADVIPAGSLLCRLSLPHLASPQQQIAHLVRVGAVLCKVSP